MKHPNGDWKHKMSGPDDTPAHPYKNHVPTNATRKANKAPIHQTRTGADGCCESGC